jgi:hypothetical protein
MSSRQSENGFGLDLTSAQYGIGRLEGKGGEKTSKLDAVGD